ncbi:response regulator transcription factor [Rhodococcus sp. I2R]|uniref:response regulator transcription factor n=1 Tax=Rhodococcus sp. I2R TaxID=2855445 RepID=UPI001E5B9301|nr:response regulator transcription factor [Rhodococcus sp. I2R]MCC8929774.1 response regulator transcription factor [Rhodococcus sp. I2R]
MRVLVVEDEPTLYEALRTGLGAEGFTVDVRTDGLSGLDAARTAEYAVIVLDVMLPGMNGYQVCRALRGAQQDTPVLMLTAKRGEYDEVEGLECGADDYLTKPFSFPVLVARIKALVRRSATVPNRDPLQVGDVELDLFRRVCSVGDDRIMLTNKEFDILAILADNRRRVVSKQLLIAHCWEDAVDATANLVEVHVSSLRRKLAGAGAGDMIETVRGHGYRVCI